MLLSKVLKSCSKASQLRKESAPQKWQSDHLPAVPMVSVQQLELRQDTDSAAASSDYGGVLLLDV